MNYNDKMPFEVIHIHVIYLDLADRIVTYVGIVATRRDTTVQQRKCVPMPAISMCYRRTAGLKRTR